MGVLKKWLGKKKKKKVGSYAKIDKNFCTSWCKCSKSLYSKLLDGVPLAYNC